MTVQTQTTLGLDIPTLRTKDTTQGDAHIHAAVDAELPVARALGLVFPAEDADSPRKHLAGGRRLGPLGTHGYT